MSLITTNAYFVTAREHIKKYGRPLAYYSDRDSIFKTTRKEGVFTPTQFTRAMEELDIAMLCATSPQAKGRVERGHKTFQDRLIKEMRLLGISTIEEANAYLEEFIEFYNKRFGKPAKLPNDAHRPLLLEHNFDYILAHKTSRKISKNLTVSYENITYQLLVEKPTREMMKKRVTVVTSTSGEVTILFKEKAIKSRVMEEHEIHAQIVKAKEINQKIINIKRFLKEKQVYRPEKNHPLKRHSNALIKRRKPVKSDGTKLLKFQEQRRKDNLEAFNDQ